MLNSGTAIRNLGEVIFAHLFLFLEAERAVISGDHLKMVLLEAVPELVLVPLLAQRRSEDVLGALEAGFVHVVNGKIKILWTGFRINGKATVAGLTHFFQRVIAAQVDD